MIRMTTPTAPPEPQSSLARSRENPTERVLVRGLGWFSIGLGAAEFFAPTTMRNLSGVRNKPLLRLYGLREIAAGVGLLTTNRPAGWLWARVAGDALDVATLVATAVRDKNQRRRAIISTVAVVGVTALDLACAARRR